jgi:uncharacterized protein (DUF302 family)
MYYIADSDKSSEQACTCIESAVTRYDFSVLHVHDLGKTLRAKGLTSPPQCKIFEVCHSLLAANLLTGDMRLNMALPCRISVYTDQGKTKLALSSQHPCSLRYLIVHPCCRFLNKWIRVASRWLTRLSVDEAK